LSFTGVAFYGGFDVYFLAKTTASGVLFYALCRWIGLSVVLSLADAPQPMPFYKFIVHAIKSNPYNKFINYYTDYLYPNAK
jgi:hypothetical protein